VTNQALESRPALITNSDTRRPHNPKESLLDIWNTDYIHFLFSKRNACVTKLNKIYHQFTSPHFSILAKKQYGKFWKCFCIIIHIPTMIDRRLEEVNISATIYT